MISALLLSQLALAQFCPSYTLSSSNNTGSCAVEAVNGTNPTDTQWQAIFQRVAQGPSGWGTSGPSVGDIGQGCGRPMATVQVSPKFPCELLKAITQVESGWRQFCVPTTPADQVGGPSRTIISFDCGYGIGQVTSGMRSFDATPTYDRARVASDPTYNLATGTRILAEKWRATRCVGDNQPPIVEHWYSATWAYNGLATVNNPNNPNYDPSRGVYRPTVGGSRPYQEKVFGWMEFPTVASRWTSLPFAYPRLSDIGTAGSPNTLPEPSCATPTSCASTRPTHVSSCFGGNADAGTGGGGGSATGGGGGSMSGGGAGGGSGGGGMATGGGSGGGGGMMPVDGGPDPEPVVYTAPRHVLGPTAGCGCSSGATLLALGALALIRRKRPTRK